MFGTDFGIIDKSQRKEILGGGKWCVSETEKRIYFYGELDGFEKITAIDFQYTITQNPIKGFEGYEIYFSAKNDSVVVMMPHRAMLMKPNSIPVTKKQYQINIKGGNPSADDGLKVSRASAMYGYGRIDFFGTEEEYDAYCWWLVENEGKLGFKII